MKNEINNNIDTVRTAQAPNGLYTQEETIVIPASDTASGTITIRKGRGDVQAFTVYAASEGATANELAQSKITLSPNGKSSIEDNNLRSYSSDYRYAGINIIPQFIEGASTVDYAINNVNNANDLVVNIKFYFYTPNQILNLREEISINC